MSFGDWDHQIRGTVSSGLELTNAIVGSGSLKDGNFTGGNLTDQTNTHHLNNTFTRGLTKGRIRTLYGKEHTTTDSRTGPGIYCMCDNLDPANNSSDYYWFGLEHGVSNQLRLVIAKGVGTTLNGALNWTFPGGADTLIASAAVITGFTLGETIPFQLEWNLDLASFGGVRLTASVGLVGDTNFSNLAVVYDIIDSTSPLTTSLIEGIGMMWPLGAPGIDDGEHTLWDSTGVFQLV